MYQESTEVASGGRKKKLLWVILGAAILACVGAAIGIPLGVVLSNVSLVATTTTTTVAVTTTTGATTTAATTTVATTTVATTTVATTTVATTTVATTTVATTTVATTTVATTTVATTTVATTMTTTACSYVFNSYGYFGPVSAPVAVAVADFNQDGKPDMVFAETGSNDILVNFGDGASFFAGGGYYSTGSSSYPRSIATADFNKDNAVDLVVGLDAANAVGVFMGHSSGSFDPMVSFTVGTAPFAVATGDVNGDTCPDIVVANSQSYTIGILLGHCDGTFAAQTTMSTGSGSCPYSVAVADFNSDGKLDIVVANHLNDNVGVFLGYGNGNFMAQVTYATISGGNPNVVRVADFNQDGKLDIVVVNNFDATSGIFLGTGSGTFSAQVTIATSAVSTSLTLCDVNNDNLPDLICSHTTFAEIGILLSNGDGTFATEVLTPTPGSGPNGIGCGDFNSDGKNDLIVTSAPGGTVYVYLNPC